MNISSLIYDNASITSTLLLYLDFVGLLNKNPFIPVFSVPLLVSKHIKASLHYNTQT